jgi:hypothetical protein
VSLLAFDHLVVAADTLEQGVAWCEAALGVTPGPGGRHALFGTHNRLMAIASERFPQAYLEIIAIDLEAPLPARPRWFGLDDAALRASLRESPRLLHAVVRTNEIDSQCQALCDLGHQPGERLRASRGALSWQILVRPDGALDGGGALPTLIQWDGAHPTEAMPPSGLALQRLVLRGLAPRVRQLLTMPGVEWLDAPGPALCATLSTPRGDVILESR